MRDVMTSMVVGVMVVFLVACGGSPGPPSPATSTPDAQGRASTATAQGGRYASAVAFSTAVELSRPPCLVDAQTVQAMRQVAEQFNDAGLELAKTNGTEGMKLVEVGLGYGVLADCREDAGPAAASAATPVGCIADVESIRRLRDVAVQGLSLALGSGLAGSDEETLASFFALNQGLLERAKDLEIACGLVSSASPVASPVRR